MDKVRCAPATEGGLRGGRVTVASQRRQRGQVLIWFLATVTASAAVFYAVYNVGQVTAAKQQATNAADAAALAGATVQARALNYMAYTNRAVIANEVFVAQVLSLESWVYYMKTTTSNLGTVTSLIPYVGEVVGPILEEISEVADVAGTALDKAVDGLVIALEAFKKLHLTATVGTIDLAYYAGGPIARDAAVHVVAANKTTFGGRSDTAPIIPTAADALTFVKNEKAWLGLSKRYAGNDRATAKNVMLASRDGFTTNRPGSALLNMGIPGVASLHKGGTTELKGYDRWEAQDYLELSIPLAKYDQPIGWGRATLAGSSGNTGSVTNPSGKSHKYTRAALKSDTHGHGSWSGVPVLRDLDVASNASEDDLKAMGIDFMVVTAKAGNKMPTTQTMGLAATHTLVNTGSADVPPKLAGDQVAAIGKARIYFERPQRNSADWTGKMLFRDDGAKEYGSLYSPYWQARLTSATVIDKEAVAAALGGAGSGLGLATP